MQDIVRYTHLNFKSALANCLLVLRQKEIAEEVIMKEEVDLGSLTSLGVDKLPIFLASRAVHELTGGIYKGCLSLPRCEQDTISPLIKMGYSPDKANLVSQIYKEEENVGRIVHLSQSKAVFPELIYIDRFYTVFNKLQSTHTASTRRAFNIISGGVWLTEVDLGRFIDEGFIVTPNKADYKVLALLHIKRR